MPFDGGFLHKISQEINALAGARIDKISQPGRELVLLTLRGSGQNRRLLLSADATAPKVHFTTQALENPKAAPMFCMLLRKHLGSGRLIAARQQGLDRVLRIVFETVNDLGDKVETSLICEIMGRHSNIILVDQSDKIIDAAKRVDFVTSEVRQVLPGMTYTPPPAQSKKSLLTIPPHQLAAAILAGRDIPLPKAILEQGEGLSPLVCREISAFVCGPADAVPSSLTPDQQERLTFYLKVVATALEEGCGAPTLVRDPQGRWVDFSYLDLRQFPPDYQVQHPESYSALLDLFYEGKDQRERMRQKTAQLHKSLCTLRDRLTRKLAAQGQELLDTAGRQRYKEWGDIISANLYRMERGDRVLRAQNFFSGQGEEVEIPLDATLSPAKNAQRYYGEYRKAATAEGKLRELIAKGEQERAYLESAIAELERAGSEEELAGIREELISQGYLRRDQRQKQRAVKLQPLRYRSSDGFLILCGRNNLQNDQLTLREARNYDLWLHTQKIHGAHVIVFTEGAREIPDRTVEEAAVIAACNSSAGTGAAAGAKIPVDYTLVRNVKKPGGAKPGMVIYETYQTAMVEPDRRRIEALREG